MAETSIRGIQIAERTKITEDGVSVEVVVDKTAARALAGTDGHFNERLATEVRRFIGMHQLAGLDVSGLRRIIVSLQKPTDSQNLFNPDVNLWKRLSVPHPVKLKDWKMWMCGESDVCQCCYCIEITVTD